MKHTPYVLIMAGGVGSRFWPASREHLPKQFLDITGSGKSLLRETVDRFLGIVPKNHIYIITHQDYTSLVQEVVPELSTEQIIGEPSRNNTAPAIALASIKLSKINPEAVCIVAPADHMIHREDEFKRVIQLAVQHAEEKDSLVTLGITPTRPDTGYGYIEFDQEDQQEVAHVKSFREKPDRQTAEQYLQSGSFVWNAGIFIWKLPVILENLRVHAPSVSDLLVPGLPLFNTPKERDFVADTYPKTEKISIDYAVLERATNVYTIPCDIDWSDLGTWSSLYDYLDKDDSGNVVLSGTVFMDGANHNLVFSKKEKLIVVKGLENHIIVDTDDCLMIYPMHDEQAIKALKEDLKENGFIKYL